MIKELFLFTIRGYQFLFSPWVGHNCRFIPTCSEYSYEAIEKFGPMRGLFLTVARLLRCHPFGGSGLDEVPEKFSWSCCCGKCSQTQNNFSILSKTISERTNYGK